MKETEVWEPILKWDLVQNPTLVSYLILIFFLVLYRWGNSTKDSSIQQNFKQLIQEIVEFILDRNGGLNL